MGARGGQQDKVELGLGPKNGLCCQPATKNEDLCGGRRLFFAKPPSLCLNTPNFLKREVGRETKCLVPEPLVQPWRNLK